MDIVQCYLMSIRTKLYLSLLLPVLNIYIYFSTMLTVYGREYDYHDTSAWGMRGRLRDGVMAWETSDLSFVTKWLGGLFLILTIATLIPGLLYFLRLRYQDPIDRYCGKIGIILSIGYLFMIFLASIIFLAITYKLDYRSFTVESGTYLLIFCFIYSIFLDFVYFDKIPLSSKNKDFDAFPAK